MKIGFFDSGLGGLTVLKVTAQELPQYDYVFYGDTANLPYGDKTEAEIYHLTCTGVKHLFAARCSIVIVACNTASAETVRKIQDEFLPTNYPDRKVLGIIIPTIETLDFPHPIKATLLATNRTVESGKYTKELVLKNINQVTLTELATPELVPFIEVGDLELATTAAIRKIESEAGESEVIILGCTHYTQIKESLREHFQASKTILSQDEIIPEKLREYLERHTNIREQLTSTGERKVHLTKHRPDYDQLMGQFLGGAYLDE